MFLLLQGRQRIVLMTDVLLGQQKRNQLRAVNKLLDVVTNRLLVI